MDEFNLWSRGLRTLGLGPELEWDPVPASTFQKRHDTFWRTVQVVVPDEESDEPYWMTTDAAIQLRDN
jgi:hypothetical protein